MTEQAKIKIKTKHSQFLVQGFHGLDLSLGSNVDGRGLVGALHLDILDLLAPIRRLSARRLHNEGQRVALALQVQLSLRKLARLRVQIDATTNQRAMHVSRHASDVARLL